MRWTCFLFLICFLSNAQAHNLDVETRSEKGELIIQVWMGDDPGEEVEISIYGDNGEMRFNGQTNAEGIMRWQPMVEEALSISVYAEAGHETEIELTLDQVKEMIVNNSQSAITESSSSTIDAQTSISQEFTSTRKNRQPLVNIIAGLGLILSLAAIWLSIRNQKRILFLENELKNRER